MRLYVIFGENTDKLTEHLSARYEIAGKERTLETAISTVPTLDFCPDVFLILGTALTSTVVNGQVNWGLALVKNLAELRRLCPHSRLVVILPEEAGDSVVREIVHLGIYDVHRVDKVRVEKIPELIDNPRTFADVGIDKAPELETGLRPAMPIEDEEDNNKKSRFSKLPKLNISIPKPRLNKTKITTDANTIQEKAIQSDVVTVLSPWILDCPVAEMSVEIADQLLRKRQKVGLIDASVKNPGISRVLGIPDTEVWEYDWRVGGFQSGIQANNLYVWPLDPLRNMPASEDAFYDLVDAALSLVDRLIINGGTDPELVAGHALVVVSPHSNHDEIVRAWEYFRPVQNGSLVVVGNAESSGFGLPAIASIDSFANLTAITKTLM